MVILWKIDNTINWSSLKEVWMKSEAMQNNFCLQGEKKKKAVYSSEIIPLFSMHQQRQISTPTQTLQSIKQGKTT